jgi:iron complex outermembrane receptor protein
MNRISGDMMNHFMKIVLITAFMVVKIATASANNVDIIYALRELSLEELLEVKVVTIATGTAQKITEAAAVTTVITADDIEAMGATDLDEVLETVPGLHISVNSIAYNSIYTIRGIYSTYNPETLILINGLPINTAQVGNHGFLWAGMSVKAISRIEVIRGPGSALYGADAFSGVINIITKSKADINGTEVGIRAGKFNTQDGWALHGASYGDVDVAVMLEYHETDGHDEIIQADAQTQLDDTFGTQASLAPGAVSMSRQNIDARLDLGYKNWQFRAGYQGRYNIGTGVGIAEALDSTGRFSSERVNADLNYHNTIENWIFDVQLAFLNMNYKPENHQTLFPPGVSFGEEVYTLGYINIPSVSERHVRFNFSSIYKGFDNHAIRLGTGYHDADMYKVTYAVNYGTDPTTNKPLTTTDVIVDLTDTPYIFLPETNRNSQYAFIQDTWDIAEKWQLTTGLRYDHYSDFGNTINPRLALVWKTTDDLTTKLLYGRAFRAPSFLDLHNQNNPIALGNPDLSPEKIETIELAFNYYVTENFNLGLNLFSYDLTDSILFIPNEQGNLQAQNIGTQQGEGFELEAEWKISDKFRLIGNYALQNSTDDTGQRVANAPKNQAYVRTDWQFIPKWHLNTQINWVDKRTRALGDTRPPVDDYTMLNLTVYSKIKDNLSLKASVRNVLDSSAFEPSIGPNYKIPYDLPLAGRSYYLEFSYQFSR